MSARRLLRIILSLVILAVVWIRAVQEWHVRSKSWLLGAITMTVVLLIVLVAELSGVTRGRPRDAVPKKPLGLDS